MSAGAAEGPVNSIGHSPAGAFKTFPDSRKVATGGLENLLDNLLAKSGSWLKN